MSESDVQHKAGNALELSAAGVEGLSHHAVENIGDGRVTSVAQHLLNYDPEKMIWQDSPSLISMVPNLLKWVIFFGAWFPAVSFAKSQGWIDSDGTDLVFYAAGGFVLLYQIWSKVSLASSLYFTRYSMTSQRLMVKTGMFSKRTNAYELHMLTPGSISAPFLLRLCGRAHLYVGLWLTGIKNAEAVRDMVRNAGQIEANRIEKIRFR